MARTARKLKPKEVKTERHVIVCAIVVETPEGTDITSTDAHGVIPTLVNEVDEKLGDSVMRNGRGLVYAVRDVTMFTERGFMFEARKHGFPRQFPDVWVDGPPKEMVVKRLRSAGRPRKKVKVKKHTTEESAR
jgi:hypothetical protein